MKDVTIVIQGRITQDTYDFYTNRYPSTNIVVSTWTNHILDLTICPPNCKILLQPLPTDRGTQNQNLQYTSTLNALHQIQTKYVIKVRGDEKFSNLEYVLDEINNSPDKIHCSPIWFRHWSFMKYHISDHIMAGRTELLKLMFSEVKHNFDNKILKYWEPEIMLTRSYLMAVEPNRFDTVDGRILMIEHFNILNLTNLQPYLIVANVFKKRWVGSGYVPESNYSISDIHRLLMTKTDVYDLTKQP